MRGTGWSLHSVFQLKFFFGNITLFSDNAFFIWSDKIGKTGIERILIALRIFNDKCVPSLPLSASSLVLKARPWDELVWRDGLRARDARLKPQWLIRFLWNWQWRGNRRILLKKMQCLKFTIFTIVVKCWKNVDFGLNVFFFWKGWWFSQFRSLCWNM